MQFAFAGAGQPATPEMAGLLRAAAQTPEGYARLAQAVSTPLNSAVLKGPITTDVYVNVYFPPGTDVEYHTDIVNPGEDKDFSAFAVPSAGAVPHKYVEGDLVRVPLFEEGNAIDTNKKYIRDARWDVVDRMMQVIVNGHVQANNRNGWRTLIAAALSRGYAIRDTEAPAGYFTPRLVAVLATAMSRHGGGNSTSSGLYRMTDLAVSLEAAADMRNWDLTVVPDEVRRQIFLGDNTLSTIHGVRIWPMFEFGEGQEFTRYYTDVLGGTLQDSRREIVLAMDLSPAKRQDLIHPWREPVTVQEDPTVARQRRFSLWSHCEHGWTVLDNRGLTIGQF